MHNRSIVAFLLLGVAGCTAATEDVPGQPDAGVVGDDASPVIDAGDGVPSPDAAVDAPPPPPVGSLTRNFTESSAELLNPERGYYVGYDLHGAGDASRVRVNGKTLAITLVRLDAYRDAPIDAAFLDSLSRGFAAARTAGVKVVVRFTYNSSATADASRARILGHLTQLTPILHANADVIAVMQAGFIGAWGEWHSSTNGLDNDADRATILNAILAALPASRQVDIRTPMFKAAALPGGPLVAAEAYTGTARARVGHHNDCFLASASDYGTYAAPVATWISYVAADGRFTAVGGETCAVYAPRSACAPAIAEMALQHWSYLNSEYNQAVLSSWDSGGCGPEIRRRLGYRLALERVTHTAAVAPGGELTLTIAIHNSGFAAPFNRRPVDVVLTRGSTRLVARLTTADARRWASGVTTTLTARLRIPATLAAGSYVLALRLPDEAPTLAADPRYAIHLANDGVWTDAAGDNVLVPALSIDPGAPGPRNAAATTFTELP
jgi:Domain of unknown function (DUF4832)/Domain of unknown function (DUF4874)